MFYLEKVTQQSTEVNEEQCREGSVQEKWWNQQQRSSGIFRECKATGSMCLHSLVIAWHLHSMKMTELWFPFCQRRLSYYSITYNFSTVRGFLYYPGKKRPPLSRRERSREQFITTGRGAVRIPPTISVEAKTMLKLKLLIGKNWLIGKGPDAGKDWRQEKKGTTEDEMVGWQHWLDGREFEQAPGVGDGQGSLACCS